MFVEHLLLYVNLLLKDKEKTLVLESRLNYGKNMQQAAAEQGQPQQGSDRAWLNCWLLDVLEIQILHEPKRL